MNKASFCADLYAEAPELRPKPFESFVLIRCAIADASRNTDAPRE